MSMALVMSEMPDVWRRVLAEHVPDPRQRCRACHQGGGHASRPCQTYRVAQEAKWVAEGNLPGTGPHGPGPSARPRLSPPEPPRREDPLAGGWRHAGPSTGENWSARPSWEAPAGHPVAGGWSGPPSGGWDAPSTGSSPLPPPSPHAPGYGPVPADSYAAVTGERPYGSTFDAPYGASFGVDDRPRAARY